MGQMWELRLFIQPLPTPPGFHVTHHRGVVASMPASNRPPVLVPILDGPGRQDINDTPERIRRNQVIAALAGVALLTRSSHPLVQDPFTVAVMTGRLRAQIGITGVYRNRPPVLAKTVPAHLAPLPAGGGLAATDGRHGPALPAIRKPVGDGLVRVGSRSKLQVRLDLGVNRGPQSQGRENPFASAVHALGPSRVEGAQHLAGPLVYASVLGLRVQGRDSPRPLLGPGFRPRPDQGLHRALTIRYKNYQTS